MASLGKGKGVEEVQSGSGRPVGGSAGSGNPVGYPVLEDKMEPSVFLTRAKELKEIHFQDLEKWHAEDSELFFQDVKGVLQFLKERYNKAAEYRLQLRNAKDELLEVQDQLERNNERMAEEKETAMRNKSIIDRLLVTEPSIDDGRQSPRAETPGTNQSGYGGPRVAKLPDPILFSGEDRTMFDDWLIQIKNKLRGNRDFYPTEELKIMYVSGRLTGNALALVTPRLDEDCQYAYTVVTELYTHLKELYSDPNKASNARRELHSLRMSPSQLFQEFYAVFLRLATESGLRHDDYKYEINERLTWTLQAGVATYYNNPAVSATAFAQHCTTEDQQNRARTVKQKRAERNKAIYGQPALPAAPVSRPSNQIFERAPAYEASASKAPNVPKTTGPLPLASRSGDKSGIKDLSTVKCYNCNEFGHFASSCPVPRTKKTRVALARMEKGLASEGEDSVGSSDSSDSENYGP